MSAKTLDIEDKNIDVAIERACREFGVGREKLNIEIISEGSNGFLGIGAKKVLLGPDAIHLLTIGGETFFATHYTKEELEALPDFDEKTVRK